MSAIYPEAENNGLNRELRKLPQVEVLLKDEVIKPLVARFSRPLVVSVIQQELEKNRKEITEGAPTPSPDKLVQNIQTSLYNTWPGFKSPVINATGVVLHTNLGRAPLPEVALDSVKSLCGSFSVLEYDLITGKRGRRAQALERLICSLTGAEAALVVNNNAAAMLLVLVAIANSREAIVSRGELVQIGGGFRVPEIMKQGGVSLVEVGTTNHTDIADYSNAITKNSALLLKIHRSNFAIRGFTSEASVGELKLLGRQHDLPVVYDIGSGAFINTEEYGMEHEPTVPGAMEQGADIVCFSGDKLFGGPQAGIIIGTEKYISMLRSHQLLRAVRIDKMAAAALEEIVLIYLNKEAGQKIPVWQMASMTKFEIQQRAEVLVKELRTHGVSAETLEGLSTIGGGSLPGQSLPTVLVAVSTDIPLNDFASRLRLGMPPVIGRIESGRYLIDLRTVFKHQEPALLQIILENYK